jgi:AraC-like DNA-binding protein
MFGYAMRTRPLKNFGMKLAVETPIGAFPLLDYLIVTCETVAHGIHQLSRYYRLNDAPYALEIQDKEDPVRVIYHGPRESLAFEYGISLVVLHLREETNNRLKPAYVTFIHQPDDLLEMQQVLGCPVRGGETCNSFAISHEAWHTPMRRRDPVLRGVLELHAEEIIARAPALDNVTGEIRRVIMARILQGETEIQSVARALGTSARSLPRRLSAAGTSFQNLIDSTRREAATRYLQDRKISIGEVAYLLGYSEPPAFHRAFKRWNGITPQEFRAKATEESAR